MVDEIAMDVWPAEDVTLPRRRMRRPVAGGIPAPQLEAWLEPLEEEWEVPGWIWFLVGMFGGGLALVAATGSLLAWWIDRWFRS